MELRILLYLDLILLCLYAAGLGAVRLTAPVLRGIRPLPVVFLCSAVGVLLLWAWPREPYFLVSSTVLLGSYLLLYGSIRELTGTPGRLPPSGMLLLTLQAAGCLFLWQQHAPVAAGVLLFCTLASVQLLLCMRALPWDPEAELRGPAWALASVFAVALAYQLWRASISYAALSHARDSLAAVLRPGDLLVLVPLSAGVLFGFLWMSTERRRLELERMARTDSLTGVLNRRAFESEFMREMSRSLRSGAPLSLLLLDVDHFKNVNDLHGHAAGDAVLCELAAILQRDLRRADLVARLGGEEFAALLPDTDASQAILTAERLRGTIESTQIAMGQSRMAVTASFGVTAWQGGEDAWERLLRRVDAAMYQAKESGRNRVQLV